MIFTFLRFLKTGTLLSIVYIFMSSIKKNRRRQNFHFQKITGTLKMKISSPRGPLFFHYFYRYKYICIQIDRWCMSTWVWPGLELCSSVDMGLFPHIAGFPSFRCIFALPPSPPINDTFLHAVNLGH